MWRGLVSPYHALESFTVQPPTVLEISTVDFQYTVRFRPGISRSQIGRHHRALSALICATTVSRAEVISPVPRVRCAEGGGPPAFSRRTPPQGASIRLTTSLKPPMLT